MIAECKAWAHPSLSELQKAKAEISSESSPTMTGDGSPFSHHRHSTGHMTEANNSLSAASRQFVDDNEITQERKDNEFYDTVAKRMLGGILDQPHTIDIDDEDKYSITRREFKNMMTSYWTIRKYTPGEGGRGLNGSGRTMPADAPVNMTRDGKIIELTAVTNAGEEVTDESDITVLAVQQNSRACCGRATQNTTSLTNDLPPCPMWMTEMAKSHEKIKDLDFPRTRRRTAQRFWWFLSTKATHVLIRAEGRGMLEQLNGGKLYDPAWRSKGVNSTASNMRSCTRRSIGSQDGTIPPSNFSVLSLGFDAGGSSGLRAHFCKC